MTNFDDILAASRAITDRYLAARSTIERLTIDPAPSDDPYRPDTDFDRANGALRDMMTDPDDTDFDPDFAPPAATLNELTFALRELLALAPDHSSAREYLTQLALEQSLCPLHMIDYAICFDDDDDECRAIRTIHPSHDT